jgi:hypothetical protein
MCLRNTHEFDKYPDIGPGYSTPRQDSDPPIRLPEQLCQRNDSLRRVHPPTGSQYSPHAERDERLE